MKKLLVILSLLVSLLTPRVVLAHVTVVPSEALTSQYQTFTVNLPTERDIPTIGLRLLIPKGVTRVSPFVKSGWVINMVTEGEGDNLLVKEVIWSGGNIPEGQRDEFKISARTPTSQGTLTWKAYQTYSDGIVVAWDRDPKEISESTQSATMSGMEGMEMKKNPYSKTEVKSEISSEKKDQTPSSSQSSANSTLPLTFSIIALAISVFALARKR